MAAYRSNDFACSCSARAIAGPVSRIRHSLIVPVNAFELSWPGKPNYLENGFSGLSLDDGSRAPFSPALTARPTTRRPSTPPAHATSETWAHRSNAFAWPAALRRPVPRSDRLPLHATDLNCVRQLEHPQRERRSQYPRRSRRRSLKEVSSCCCPKLLVKAPSGSLARPFAVGLIFRCRDKENRYGSARRFIVKKYLGFRLRRRFAHRGINCLRRCRNRRQIWKPGGGSILEATVLYLAHEAGC